MSYVTVLLESSHQKSNFCCGTSMLDTYLHKQAKQDIKRHLAACFVMLDNNQVKGYYTLSNSSIDREIVADDIKNKLPPSYHNLPVTLLGRLARDLKYNNQRLGETLLVDALKRSYHTSFTIASMAVIVNPIDDAAINFYLKYGFLKIPDTDKMFMSMAHIAQLFK